MSKSLKNKLKMLAAGVGLAGAVAGSSGCLGPMAMGVGAARGNAGLYAWGAGMSSIESAETGRSQTNVIIASPGQPVQQTNPNYHDGKMSDGSYYRGGVLNNRMEGDGIWIRGDLRIEGTFKNGMPWNVKEYLPVDGRLKLVAICIDGEFIYPKGNE